MKKDLNNFSTNFLAKYYFEESCDWPYDTIGEFLYFFYKTARQIENKHNINNIFDLPNSILKFLCIYSDCKVYFTETVLKYFEIRETLTYLSWSEDVPPQLILTLRRQESLRQFENTDNLVNTDLSVDQYLNGQFKFARRTWEEYTYTPWTRKFFVEKTRWFNVRHPQTDGGDKFLLHFLPEFLNFSAYHV